MPNEITQSENPDASAEAGEPAQPPIAAPLIPVPPLPGRIDSGRDVDQILGEVSQVFGRMAGQKEESQEPSSDEIDAQLSELTAEGAPSTEPRPAELPPEMPIAVAADLFRASTDDRSVVSAETGDTIPQSLISEAAAPEIAAHSPTKREQAASDETVAPAASDRPFGSANALAASLPGSLGPLLTSRLSRRARVPAALAAAMLIGWAAGVLLSRPAAQTKAAIAVREEQAEAVESKASHASDARAAEYEAELQRAIKERDAARHNAEQAGLRLKNLEIEIRSAATPKRAEVERRPAAQLQAEEAARSAADSLRTAELRAYDAQLARVRDLWMVNPGLAVELLNDADRCPPRLRDFVWGYFIARAKRDQGTFQIHRGSANAVAWSPDGGLLVTGGQDGRLKFHDAKSCREIASIMAHTGGVAAVAFAESGGRLASAGADGAVRLWDGQSRKLISAFLGHLDGVRGVVTGPEPFGVISAGNDGTVRFWDLATRRAVATRWANRLGTPSSHLVDVGPIVYSLARSPDGRLIASGGNGTIRIWDADGIAEKANLSLSNAPITALAFRPRGATLVAGTEGSLYRVSLNAFATRPEPTRLAGPVNSLAYASDGGLLAAAVGNDALVFHEPVERSGDDGSRRTGENRFAPSRLRGHVGLVNGVAFSPDGESLATCGADGTLRLWNSTLAPTDTAAPNRVIADGASALAYSADGMQLAMAQGDAIRVWNPTDGVETAKLRNRAGAIRAIAFAPDGKTLASANDDWPILVWDLESQRVRTALNGHSAAVNSLEYSRDAKLLISASDDGTIRLWDPVSGRELVSFREHAGSVLCAFLSPDGKVAASGGADCSIKIWDVAGRRSLATLAGHHGPVAALAFSPDGRVLLSMENPSPGATASSADESRGAIRAWSMPSGKMLRSFGMSGAAASRLVVSPDGKTLAVSERSGASLWDFETGDLRESLGSGSAGRVRALAFAPNGLTLTAGGETAVVMWKAAPYFTQARPGDLR